MLHHQTEFAFWISRKLAVADDYKEGGSQMSPTVYAALTCTLAYLDHKKVGQNERVRPDPLEPLSDAVQILRMKNAGGLLCASKSRCMLLLIGALSGSLSVG